VGKWFNLPNDKASIEITDFKGKVVYLFGFQSWCPGCHSHGFPALKAVESHFDDNDDVVFVAIQTVFEGFHTNTADKARSNVEDFELDIPVGHDPGPGNAGSTVMRRYRSGGTPWTVIIDRNGVVRFNDFSIQPQRAISLIDQLVASLPVPPHGSR
jgi:thiol-disulfide isomerase/thioredoxin